VHVKPGHARNRSMDYRTEKENKQDSTNLLVLDDNELHKKNSTVSVLDPNITNQTLDLTSLGAPISTTPRTSTTPRSSITSLGPISITPRSQNDKPNLLDEDFEPRAKINLTTLLTTSSYTQIKETPRETPRESSTEPTDNLTVDAYSFFDIPDSKLDSSLSHVFDDIPKTIQEVHLRCQLIPELQINEIDWREPDFIDDSRRDN